MFDLDTQATDSTAALSRPEYGAGMRHVAESREYLLS
jgi:hypothetical protein